jgi:hypothetical protein
LTSAAGGAGGGRGRGGDLEGEAPVAVVEKVFERGALFGGGGGG